MSYRFDPPVLTLEEAVKQLTVYSFRLKQLKRETMIANRMVREANEEIERIIDAKTEILHWEIMD